MKWFLLSALLLGLGTVVHAQSADDAYLKLHSTLQQADTLNQNGQYRAAAEKYLEVQNGLKRFPAVHPGFNPKVISYRLNYVNQRLETIVRYLPPVETTAGVTNSPAPGASFELSSKRPSRTEQDGKIESLNGEVRRLESEKANLEAKLREALAIKPADLDPKQLARAEERVAALQKEKDLLQVALQQERERVAQLQQEPQADPKRLRELERERDELKSKLNELLSYQTDSESRYQRQIKISEDKLKELDQLQKERDELDKRLSMTAARLKVVEDESKKRKPSKSDLKDFDKLQQEKERLETKFYGLAKELSDLQSNREKELKAHQAALRRVRELETEKDKLEIRLAQATAGQPVASADANSAANPELLRQLAELQAKLSAYEAKAAPFTPEELALFKKPGASSESAFYLANRPTMKELPSKAQQLVVEGDRAFVEQRYKDAEKKYSQVLEVEGKNVYALANLASAQIEMQRTEDAEHSLNRALTIEPNDPFSLLLLGKLKLSEGDTEASFEALSRSVKLNPDSAEAQNYLGIVLSEKGQRVAAEAALRKAIQVQPDYAGAHHNLAIIYATQKPPFMELARWHYQKAVSLGHGKNPQLEGMIAEK